MRKFLCWSLAGWLAVSPAALALAQSRDLGQTTVASAPVAIASAPVVVASAPVVVADDLAKPDGWAAPSTAHGVDGAGQESQEGVAAWVVSQGKTVTYRIAASIDALIVGYLYTGTLLGGGGIALFNAVVSSILYDLHEVGWNSYGPDPATDPTGIALVKTVSYRVVSIANVLATGLFFTGNLLLSTGLALGNAVIDSTIYFFHELAWNYWGPTIKQEGAAEADPAAARHAQAGETRDDVSGIL